MVLVHERIVVVARLIGDDAEVAAALVGHDAVAVAGLDDQGALAGAAAGAVAALHRLGEIVAGLLDVDLAVLDLIVLGRFGDVALGGVEAGRARNGRRRRRHIGAGLVDRDGVARPGLRHGRAIIEAALRHGRRAVAAGLADDRLLAVARLVDGRELLCAKAGAAVKSASVEAPARRSFFIFVSPDEANKAGAPEGAPAGFSDYIPPCVTVAVLPVPPCVTVETFPVLVCVTNARLRSPSWNTSEA